MDHTNRIITGIDRYLHAQQKKGSSAELEPFFITTHILEALERFTKVYYSFPPLSGKSENMKPIRERFEVVLPLSQNGFNDIYNLLTLVFV